jgi:hypothetical protein
LTTSRPRWTHRHVHGIAGQATDNVHPADRRRHHPGLPEVPVGSDVGAKGLLNPGRTCLGCSSCTSRSIGDGCDARSF